MGYISVSILVGVVLIVVIIGSLNGAKKPPTGNLSQDHDKAPAQPSADAPTPARSVIESPAQVEKAREHTPPA